MPTSITSVITDKTTEEQHLQRNHKQQGKEEEGNNEQKTRHVTRILQGEFIPGIGVRIPRFNGIVGYGVQVHGGSGQEFDDAVVGCFGVYA